MAPNRHEQRRIEMTRCNSRTADPVRGTRSRRALDAGAACVSSTLGDVARRWTTTSSFTSRVTARFIVPLVVLVTSALVVSCTTSDVDLSEVDNPTPTTQKIYTRDAAGLVESISDRFATVGSNLNEWAAPKDQARCAGEKVVERLGVDRLLALGFDPQLGQLKLPYAADEQASVLNILVGCIDFQEGLLELLAAYQKLDVKASACVASAIERLGLTRELVSGLLTGSEVDPFANDNRVGSGITRAMVECLQDGDLIPVIPQDPFPQDKFEEGTTTIPAPLQPSTTLR